MKQPVIAIIGAGCVGSTAAYACIVHDVAAKILMVDANVDKCEGEVQDLEDALSTSRTSTITSASLKEAAQADIIVITAGIAQKPGQTRLEILKTNYDVIGSIIKELNPIKKESILIMVTNPVDILTRYAQEISGLPRNQVFGSGTLLDSYRMRGFLGKHLSVNPASIEGYVLGEHGDSQFVAWSTVRVGGLPVSSFSSVNDAVLNEIAMKSQKKAYDLISCKGFTAFGIASVIAAYCKAIIDDAKRIYPVSCFIQDLDVCLSMPAVLGARGVEYILRPPLSSKEQEQLVASARVLDEQYKVLI